MNKRAYIFCLIVFIMGFCVAYFAGVKEGSNDVPLQKERAAYVKPKEKSENSSEEGYWVKSVDNVIIVYKSDKKTIVAETDINIAKLSEKERNILMYGIYLENSEELFKYLEANTSWWKDC